MQVTAGTCQHWQYDSVSIRVWKNGILCIKPMQITCGLPQPDGADTNPELADIGSTPPCLLGRSIHPSNPPPLAQRAVEMCGQLIIAKA